ncbi:MULTISPECIES: lipopolysaccharide biosynthesis protein [unclassified Paracoccus (in: a-proteobacteria)]|uniref:lipopolysaccharide biosynthesis protein n=1 Tax=unclassified Paracoccus (in: a-proteobacteria) TaxID=2688777 RepID=UPI0019D6170B|nr:lipopolysaccharide biosynthesis protein [Paracoccus sp. Arc7-R13]
MKRGALATGGAQLVKLICQIISVIVLSRLLQPEDFGIVAMAAPVVAFVGLFLDMGLTQATVQKKAITSAEINSLFWINMAVSALLGAIMILIAPFVAKFYGEPQVAPLVALMSLQLLVAGLGAQHYALVTRRMAFGRLAMLDSLSAVLGLAAAIVWAYYERTYWALFVGGMTTMICSTLGCWISSRWRPGMPRWVSGTKEMVNFGAGITGFNFANYFSRNIDQILIGRQWGNQQLGLYDRANRLLLFPLQQVIYPLGKVMVPALSRMNNEPERYRKAYLRVAPLLLFVALPGVAVAIAMADLLIPLALGRQWEGAVMIFQALGFAGMLQPLNSPAGWLFISQGRTRDFMLWGMFGAMTMTMAVIIGLPYGAFGVALAYAILEYLRTPLLWIYVGRIGAVEAKHILRVASPFVVGAHVAVALLWFLQSHLPGGSVVTLIIATILSYMIVTVIASLFAAGRETLAEVRILASRMLIIRLGGTKT